MEINRGVAPLDPSSDVGKFRLLIGATSYEELDPPEVGYGDYGMFSDDEIQVFLDQGETLEDSAYLAYMQLAAAAAIESKSVKDFDLQVDLTKRSGDLRAIALMWRERADAASADIFEVFDISDDDECFPEAAPRTVGRCRSWR